MELEQLGNPFIVDESVELFQLDTKDVIGEAVVMTVKTTEEIGKRKYEELKKARTYNYKEQACSFQAVKHKGTIFEI